MKLIGNNNKRKVKFYLLCILGRKHGKYDEISKNVRGEIEYLLTDKGDNNNILDDFTFEKGEGELNNHESWYIWKGKTSIKINNLVEECDITIKHYKVRIIIEVTREYTNDDFSHLFLEARKDRGKLIKIAVIKKLLALKIEKDFDKIYFYPFIQIFKEYKPIDFNSFGDEAITSFFYEVPDARRESVFSFLCEGPKKTVIRVSRPSIIATKMSEFMVSELINTLYDKCLLSLRENKTNEVDEKIFEDMRDAISRVLFEHEEMMANTEVSRSVNTLSIIMSIGAIAAILAIMYELPDILISKVGRALLIFIFIILIFFILKFSRYGK